MNRLETIYWSCLWAFVILGAAYYIAKAYYFLKDLGWIK